MEIGGKQRDKGKPDIFYLRGLLITGKDPVVVAHLCRNN